MVTLAQILLMATLMLAPLAFGAVQPWVWGAMAMAVVLVVLLWAAGCMQSGAVRLTGSWLYLPWLALLMLAALQLRFRWTMDAIGTREALLKLLNAMAIFFLAQHLFADTPPRVWHRTAASIVIYACAMALFAIVGFFARPDLLYGVVEPRGGGEVFGPYVNHNHYAGLMEMLTAMTIGVSAALPQASPHKVLVWFAACISLVSVFLSGSRGGSLAVAVELGIFAVALRVGGQRRRLLISGLVLAALCGICLFWLAPAELWQRWRGAVQTPELTLERRIRISRDAIELSRHLPVCGAGLGAFAVAYPPYQSIATDQVIDYAHNDYVQLLAEAGAMAWMLIPVSIATFVWLAFGADRWRRMAGTDGIRCGLQFGAAVGVCGILVHSLSDFNLHIPANAAWFAFSLALGTMTPESMAGSSLRRRACL